MIVNKQPLYSRMIVAKPAWTRHLKSSRTLWRHQWHEVPFAPTSRVQTGNVVCLDDEPGRFHACVYSYGTRTNLDEFGTLVEAQVACDAYCSAKLGVPVDEAIANWRAWTRTSRAAAKIDRDRRLTENETKLTPEARERSRRLADALDPVTDEQRRS